MNRLIRLVIVVVIAFVGWNVVSNPDNSSVIESMMDRGSGTIGGGFDKINESLGGTTGGMSGDRPYKDTNQESMEILSKNIGEFATTPGYERAQFGTGWNRVSDPNSVGFENFPNKSCDVRRAVLIEQGSDVKYDDKCDITSGTWVDPYGYRDSDGKVAYHESGNSREFDIDHVVALSLSWRSGMDKVDDDVRNQLANDRANLLISEASINRSKGDSDISDWTPPVDSESYCDYADRYAHVKAKYNLTLTQNEYNKLEGILSACNR